MRGVCHCSEVMSHPVTTFDMNETVGHVVNVLKKDLHEGFPVVDRINPAPVSVAYKPVTTGPLWPSGSPSGP